jgi:hypothetical protein
MFDERIITGKERGKNKTKTAAKRRNTVVQLFKQLGSPLSRSRVEGLEPPSIAVMKG